VDFRKPLFSLSDTKIFESRSWQDDHNTNIKFNIYYKIVFMMVMQMWRRCCISPKCAPKAASRRKMEKIIKYIDSNVRIDNLMFKKENKVSFISS